MPFRPTERILIAFATAFLIAAVIVDNT